MAKDKDKNREKDRQKNQEKRKKDRNLEAVAAEAAPPQPGGAEATGLARADDMRRIAREAAWARMFGRNSTRNPFGEPS